MHPKRKDNSRKFLVSPAAFARSILNSFTTFPLTIWSTNFHSTSNDYRLRSFFKTVFHPYSHGQREKDSRFFHPCESFLFRAIIFLERSKIPPIWFRQNYEKTVYRYTWCPVSIVRWTSIARNESARWLTHRRCISILRSARANKFRKSLEFVVPGEREGSRDPNETISFTRHRSSAGRETRIIVHLFIRSIGNAITTVHNGYGRRNYRANRHLRFIVSLTTELCILFS